MIPKDELKGKYVRYLDIDGKLRCGKVSKVVGNYLTMKDVLKKKRRVYKDKVIGRQLKNKIVEIDWKKRGKNMKKSKAFTVNFKDLVDKSKNPKLSLSVKDIEKNKKIPKKYL